MRRGPVWSPKGMAIRSGAGNSLSRHSQNQTTTCGLLSIHRFFPLLPQTYQVHLLTFCFNPHTHERCDMINTNDIAYAVMFQSTHPRGVRLRFSRGKTKAGKFQSTHPRGVRQKSLEQRKLQRCFNPRTREGCDHEDLTSSLDHKEFQSTHPRGVRLRKFRHKIKN